MIRLYVASEKLVLYRKKLKDQQPKSLEEAIYEI